MELQQVERARAQGMKEEINRRHFKQIRDRISRDTKIKGERASRRLVLLVGKQMEKRKNKYKRKKYKEYI